MFIHFSPEFSEHLYDYYPEFYLDSLFICISFSSFFLRFCLVPLLLACFSYLLILPNSLCFFLSFLFVCFVLLVGFKQRINPKGGIKRLKGSWTCQAISDRKRLCMTLGLSEL